MTLHFLNDVANDAQSTQKIENFVIIASKTCETMGKLINRIPGSCLLISSLPGSAFRTYVELLASLAMSTSILKALPGKLDIKRHSPSILLGGDRLKLIEKIFSRREKSQAKS